MVPDSTIIIRYFVLNALFNVPPVERYFSSVTVMLPICSHRELLSCLDCEDHESTGTVAVMVQGHQIGMVGCHHIDKMEGKFVVLIGQNWTNANN
jgi:hypothetical protein